MISYIIQVIMNLLPDTRMYGLKVRLLRIRGFRVAYNARIVSSVKLKLQNIYIGNNTFIGHETFVSGGVDSMVSIGSNVDIGPRCIIVAGTHEIGDNMHRAGEGRGLSITVGDGTWIGANVTILGGVTIGKGCVIAAGSVVPTSLEDNSLCAGVPAKIIRKLQ